MGHRRWTLGGGACLPRENNRADGRGASDLCATRGSRAYAPYSGYAVGAVVLAVDGGPAGGDEEVILGCNVENAAYPAGICAERVALTAAIALGRRKFKAIAVATEDGGAPCGMCRQVMSELGPQMVVYVADGSGAYRTTTVAALLPNSFSAANLDRA